VFFGMDAKNQVCRSVNVTDEATARPNKERGFRTLKSRGSFIEYSIQKTVKCAIIAQINKTLDKSTCRI